MSHLRSGGETCTASNFVQLTEPNGIIASVSTQESICGSYKSPWMITALPGQTIRVHLVDFSVTPLTPEAVVSGVTCVAYASIREQGVTRPTTVCGARQYDQMVYESRSNQVEIIIQGSQQNQRYFLLQYTCKCYYGVVYGELDETAKNIRQCLSYSKAIS